MHLYLHGMNLFPNFTLKPERNRESVVREQRFIDWCWLLCIRLLDDAVYNGWNAQLSPPAIRGVSFRRTGWGLYFPCRTM